MYVEGRHGFEFVPSGQLEVSGWARSENSIVDRFYGPSPEVLLSPWFGRTHCFSLALSNRAADRVGLGFESIADSLDVGMSGVFWLDSSSWRLLEIEFRFTGLRELEQAKHQGGVIVLDSDDNGGWYVTEWHMRRPILRRGRLAWTSGVRGRTATRQYTTVGYVERAGRVLAVESGGR
jgi:hypothetical protein